MKFVWLVYLPDNEYGFIAFQDEEEARAMLEYQNEHGESWAIAKISYFGRKDGNAKCEKK